MQKKNLEYSRLSILVELNCKADNVIQQNFSLQVIALANYHRKEAQSPKNHLNSVIPIKVFCLSIILHFN